MERLVDESLKQVFLGWERPLLPSAVEYLLSSEDGFDPFRFQNSLVVLPGKRAGRRFRELLTIAADKAGRGIVLPEVVSVGSLPEVLSGSSVSYLSDAELTEVFFSLLVKEKEISSALGVREGEERALARSLLSLRSLLGRAGLTFRSAYTKAKESVSLSGDEFRWDALQRLEDLLSLFLEENALYERTFHRLSLLEEGRWQTHFKEILLIGVPDLYQLQIDFLSRVTRDSSLTSLIPIPEEHNAGVGEYGELVPEYWKELHRSKGVEGLNVFSVSSEEGEAAFVADTVLQVIKSDNGKVLRQPQEVTVSFADENHLPYVEQTFQAIGIPFHSFKGVAPQFSSFALWCDAVARFLETGTYDDFMKVLRSKWSEMFFESDNLEQYFNFLETKISDRCLFRVFPASKDALPKLEDEQRELFERGGDFFEQFRGERTPRDFCALVLAELLKTTEESKEEAVTTEESLATVKEALLSLNNQFSQIGEGGTFSGGELFRMLGAASREVGENTPQKDDAPPGVELIGWLETLHDDAPVLSVCGFHDGAIPGIMREGAWLPGRLKEALGVEGEARVFARDYFFLLHALHSREDFTVVVPKRSSGGDFYKPSRLLFGGGKKEIVERTERLFHEKPFAVQAKLFGNQFGGSKGWELTKPSFELAEPITTVPVTAFRDYIQCPFRFYLTHVEKLRGIEGEHEELNALLFGTLFHEVVAKFGVSAVKDSSSASAIEKYVLGELDGFRRELLGFASKPAVDVQLLHLEERLKRFSELQAEWRDLGWRIEAVETPFPKGAVKLKHEAGETSLSGRIDRIDYHPKEKQYIALDYKTSARKRTPEQIHQQDDGWSDLQLPLYHLALASGAIVREEALPEVLVGYFSLPESAADAGISIASWEKVEFEDAVALASELAGEIATGKFWPPTEEAFRFDPYAELLGGGQYRELYEQLEAAEERRGGSE